MDYLRLKLRQSRHWSWFVHENRSHLGRLVIVLNCKCHGSLTHCTHEEWMSLRPEISLYEDFLLDLFKPDKFNYAQMGNELEQLRVHAIPRYRSSREWGGIVIKDVRWGQNPSPKPASPFTETEVYAFSEFMMNELDRYLSRKASKNELRILSADI